MQNTTMWLARERMLDARQSADRERVARIARQAHTQPSLLRRIRGAR